MKYTYSRRRLSIGMHIRKEHQIVSVQGDQVRDWQLELTWMGSLSL